MDADDHYKEGWYSGYWSYWLSDAANPWEGADWTDNWEYSGSGMGSRELTDGCWDGWSFADFASYGSGAPPDEPVAAIPEPATLALLALGGFLLRCRR
ncbi:MAG TPA: PEP-CTERM sorting domain-containing protein [Desulfobacteraceae bacterium]|nr:PEP-CTERM sorting domain-containing protein [Desulfobacteraceae bacterium]